MAQVPPTHALPRALDIASRPVLLGWLVVAASTSALLGWANGDLRWTFAYGNNPPLSPQAAVIFVLVGLAVVLFARDGRNRTFLAVAGAVCFAAGLAHLAVALVEEPTALDRLLFADQLREAGQERLGRLPPTTCLGMSGSGIALIALARRRTMVAHFGSLFLAIVSVGILSTYPYSDLTDSPGGTYSHVSIHSALSFTLLAVAVMRLTPDHGISRLVAQSPVARLMMLRVFPVVLVVPFAVGWLLLRTEELDLFDRDLAEALMASVSAAIAGAVVLRSAVVIADYETDLTKTLDALEGEVHRRTSELQSLNAMLRESLDAMEEGLALVTRDADVRLLNKAGSRILGYTAEEVSALLKATRWETFREDGTPMQAGDQPIVRTISRGEPTTGVFVRWRAKDGAMVLLRVTTRPLVDETGVWAAVVAFTDYTGHRGSDAEWSTSAADADADVDDDQAPRDPAATTVPGRRRPTTPESRNRILLAAAASDQAKDLHGALAFAGYQIVVANDGEAALELTRRQRPSLVLVHADAPVVGGYDVLTAVKADLLIASTAVVVLDPRPTGLRTAAALEAGAIDVLRLPIDDVELLARIEASMRVAARTRDLLHLSRSLDRASRTDPLTGLLNRRGIDDEIERHATSAAVSGDDCGVLALDLDRFKEVNDTHGHLAGDRALEAVAEAILHELRSEDVGARWGGEEFLVLLPHTDEAGTVAAAERIRTAVAALRIPDDDGEPFVLTTSIGAALAKGGRVKDAVTVADQRLLAAKAAGRNCVVSVDPSTP